MIDLRPAVAVVALVLAVPASAGELARKLDRATAALALNGEEIAKSDGELSIKVIRADEMGECEEDTCPPVHLFLALRDDTGDSGFMAAFELQPAQDWKFVRWKRKPADISDFAELVLTRTRFSAQKGMVKEELVVEISATKASITWVGPARRTELKR